MDDDMFGYGQEGEEEDGDDVDDSDSEDEVPASKNGKKGLVV